MLCYCYHILDALCVLVTFCALLVVASGARDAREGAREAARGATSRARALVTRTRSATSMTRARTCATAPTHLCNKHKQTITHSSTVRREVTAQHKHKPESTVPEMSDDASFNLRMASSISFWFTDEFWGAVITFLLMAVCDGTTLHGNNIIIYKQKAQDQH